MPRHMKMNVIELPEETPEYESPCPADDLPSFREAFPDATYLDDNACDALCRAIVVRTAQDYYDVATDPIEMTKEEFKDEKWKQKRDWDWLMSKTGLHYFVRSKFFNMISNIEPKHFERTMVWRKLHGKKIPNISDPDTVEHHKQKRFTQCHSVDI